MAKQPNPPHSEGKQGREGAAALDKKKRLADALRRNLAKRKLKEPADPASKAD